MFKAVDKLKNAVNNLESSLLNEDAKETLIQIKKIVELSSNMYNKIKIIEEESNLDDNTNIICDKTDLEVFEHTSSMDFLYKPTTIENYYEGNYLEMFSERRTSELKDCQALHIHNKFWTANSVIYGNIFGSIPKDLISKDSINKLLTYGWKSVVVYVFEIKKDLEYHELYDICKKNFEKYLIVNETKNNTKLVLVFKV
ncbi:hypothetical protein [Abyssisolibacter fermentans]|uniref:hypothetical protein n=1 Tax=Abyssisolibacter fermentans TaxID=1766203 RepID=UPI00083444E7|nr:hypothetical protein [Abyssisolibacter fermentans]